MFDIRASVHDRERQHEVTLDTNGSVKALAVPPRAQGRGSGVNGGELLMLAVATCACNDLHREAARRGLVLDEVLVEAHTAFAAAPGSAAGAISYEVTLTAAAPEEELVELARHTDTVAEVHNTLRRGTPVTLSRITAVDTRR